MTARADTIVDLLRGRAQAAPNRTGYVFLPGREGPAESLTYGDLDRQARAIAVELGRHVGEGDRVLVVLRPGLEYVAAFFGCLFAGAVAVPVYPPRARASERDLPRLRSVAASARPSAALTTPELAEGDRLRLIDPLFGSLATVASADVDRAGADAWSPPAVAPTSVAFLQYTSGSTAAPKGVVLTHDNLLQNVALIEEAFCHNEATIGCSWLPPYHDMGLIGGILQPLYTGFPVVLMPPTAFVQRPLEWLQAITRYRVTTTGGPNFAYDLCVRRVTIAECAELDLSSWKVAFNGAEPVRAETLDRFAEHFEACGFRHTAHYPCYGLAEATLLVSGGQCAAGAVVGNVSARALEDHRVAEPSDDDDAVRLVASGRPMPGHEVRIVDPELLTPRPDGTVGEIWLAGPSVASGYWGLPDETAETFSARLGDDGQPFLRTGDLGFIREGELFVTGRLKDLIVIRGRNYYPQDFELLVAQSDPALEAEGAAFSVDIGGEERLVMVQEASRHASADDLERGAAAIRSAVSEAHELAVHDVVLIRVRTLPRTSSGKVQRRRCRRLYLDADLAVVHRTRAPTGAAVARTPRPGSLAQSPDHSDVGREAVVAYLRGEIARTLQVALDDVDPQSSLVSLGLDSLAAIELQHGLERDLGAVVRLAALFEAPSISALAAAVAGGETPGEALALPDPGDAPVRASIAQEALWFLQHLDPKNPAYNVAAVVRLRGRLDLAALRAAIRQVMQRHESLRTSFVIVERELLQVVGEVSDAPVTVLPVGGSTPDERLRSAFDAATAEARRPFQLDAGPLMRVAVTAVADEDHVAAFVFHHAVCDGWSLGVFAREAAEAYVALAAGHAPPRRSASVQYGTYSLAQRKWLGSDECRRQLEYWTDRLRDVPDLALPTDFPRPRNPPAVGAVVTGELGQAGREALEALARLEETTVFAVLLAAWQALLSRQCDQESFAVGVAVAARPHAALADAVGLFVNAVALPCHVSPEASFRDLLRRVRGDVLGLHAAAGVPFEHVVANLRVDRCVDRNPVFQVMFSLRPPLPRPDFGDVDVEVLEVEAGGVKFDLSLEVDLGQEGVRWWLRYPTELFDRVTVEAISRRFERLVTHAVEAPDATVGDLSILAPSEREVLVSKWAQPARRAVAAGLVHERIEAAADRASDAAALVFEGDVLTYGELDRRANRLAHHLAELGAGPDVPVGLYLERSPEAVVALLAIMKAGGAYVPFDASTPAARVTAAVAAAGMPIVVTREALGAAFGSEVAPVCVDPDDPVIRSHADSRLAVHLEPTNLAYVIFTSGSTGAPKGVAVEHRQLVSYLDSVVERLDAPPNASYRTFGTFAADGTHTAIFCPLCAGGSLHLAPDHLAFDARALTERCKHSPVDILKIAPSHLAALLEGSVDPVALLPRRKLVIGGEAPTLALLKKIRMLAPRLAIMNQYGPTETTVGVLTHDLRVDDPPTATVPLGRPLANTEAYVVDRRLEPVPVGVVGELVIGGAAVARGYLNQPGATAIAYIPSPFESRSGARAYRTGDRVRWLGDGTIEFLGRADDQVKIRGNRVECGEIEATLRAYDAVGDAVVLPVVYGRADEPRLVAYVVPAGEDAPDVHDVRRFLRERLPAYMVPSAFAVIDAIPLTKIGKRDTQALQRIPLQTDERGRPAVALARTTAERVVADAWRAVLGSDVGGIDDNFFDVGGHSLLLVSLQREIERRHGQEVPLLEILKRPTIAGQARYLGGADGEADTRAVAAATQRGQERLASRRRRAQVGPRAV